jgi:hypothetical protein
MHPTPTIHYYSHASLKLPIPDTIQCGGRVYAWAPNCLAAVRGKGHARNPAIEICYLSQSDPFSLTWDLHILALTLGLKH